jgi:hypothetical protein
MDGERRGPETEAHPRFVRGKEVLAAGAEDREDAAGRKSGQS